ncbi:ABC transporter permease subunit [Enterococcus cecorum]
MDATMINTLTTGIIETIYMVFISMIVTYVFGLPLGVILFVTDKGSLYPNRIVNLILGFLVNVFRSIPFLILLVLLLPFTRFVVGTTLGSTATIVPLVVSAIPFVARMVESSLKEVDAWCD